MKDKTEVWWTRHNKTMPDMAKLQAIVTQDIDLKHPKNKLVKANQKEFVPPTDPLIFARGYVQTEAEIIKFGDGWETKYTNSKAGSGLCSGWTTAGKAQYKKFLKHIKRGRNKPTTPAKEALVYAQVRRSIKTKNPFLICRNEYVSTVSQIETQD
jgi:hypothetical protein